MHIGQSYTVTCIAVAEDHDLESDWKSLEAKANNTFFLSWTWISVWLSVYRPSADVLRVRHNGGIVGMAIVVKAQQRRFYFLNSKLLMFHQTGNLDEDQIWIEYNGFLAQASHYGSVVTSGINFLMSEYDGWDELVIGAISQHEAEDFEHQSGLMRHNIWEAPSYGIDLKTLRENQKTYLSTLSHNTRYQINRACKKYRTLGEIRLKPAALLTEAIQFFNEISPLHIARWGGEVYQSGFANPKFVDFHLALINRAWPDGLIDVIRLQVADRTIAYFYNFLYRKRVYFYLSGLVSESDSTLKPGLLGHALCAQRYMENGFDYYDFMGGGERYKSSLATKSYHLYKMTLQKRMIKFGLEQFGRKIKYKVIRAEGTQP